jgi:predicted TIM-barrel fold metal-dependent hydrolase
MFKQKKHLHFAHGWCWGVVCFALMLGLVTGLKHGYIKYWLSGDYDIVNAHEVIQSTSESEKLYEAMRNTHIATTVLVGTPSEIIYYDGTTGFSGYDGNNEDIIAVQNSNPKHFIAFCTVDPSDPNAVEIIQSCLVEGGQGVKLYSGHSFFYQTPLDDTSFDELYTYLESENVPVIFHVNAAKYQAEFENVLSAHPGMSVVCPHFCLSSKNLQRLSYLFDTYPNLYSDISFGDESYLLEGAARISEDASAYRDFITKYADRFFYGTDVVVTDYEGKDAEWLTQFFQIYRDLLEKESYEIFLDDSEVVYSGLALSPEVLEKIYETNWANFMAPAVEEDTTEVLDESLDAEVVSEEGVDQAN